MRSPRPNKAVAKQMAGRRAARQAPGRARTTRNRREDVVLFSACMIVKDEEATLPDCLESLHRLVDEVVVYDTGSTDGTMALARRAGARVVQGYWDDDFARARNACLEHCKGEWILWVDADERFVCHNIPELRRVLETHREFDVLAVDIHNVAENDLGPPCVHRAMRIFRKSTCCWHGSIHEQVGLRAGLGPQLRGAPLKGPRIDHYGYQATFMEERDKLARNLRLAQAALNSE